MKKKNWKKKLSKINFINLFGLEVRKILFLGFTKCKTEGNKFLEIYLSGENFSVKNWKKKINFINLFGYEEKIIFYDFTSGKI